MLTVVKVLGSVAAMLGALVEREGEGEEETGPMKPTLSPGSSS